MYRNIKLASEELLCVSYSGSKAEGASGMRDQIRNPVDEESALRRRCQIYPPFQSALGVHIPTGREQEII